MGEALFPVQSIKTIRIAVRENWHASVVSIFKNKTKRFLKTQIWPDAICSVFSRTFNLKEALNSIGVQTCAEVNKALKERGSPTLNAEVQANLVGQFSSLEEKGNPVCTLMGEFSLFLNQFLLQFNLL